MKFFIDTADVREIEDLAASGLVDGVTTNPSLIAKSGRNFVEVVRETAPLVLDTPIRHSPVYQQAGGYGTSVFYYTPRNSIARKDYGAAAEDVAALLKERWPVAGDRWSEESPAPPNRSVVPKPPPTTDHRSPTTARPEAAHA